MTTDAGTQANALPGADAPPGSIIPPTAATMENATYVAAGARIEKMVSALINKRERFKDLRGVTIAIVWSRNQAKRVGGEDVLAWPAMIGLLEQHFAKEVEANLPELAIVLSYKAAAAMREKAQWIHPDILERHLARALLSVEVSEGGIISTVGPDVVTHSALVGWYGVHSEGEVAMRGQLELFDGDEAKRQQNAGRRSRPKAGEGDPSTPDPDALAESQESPPDPPSS